MSNAALLVYGFFPPNWDYSWIFSIFITFAERQFYISESKTLLRWAGGGGGRGAVRPVLCINESKKSDARSLLVRNNEYANKLDLMDDT